MQVTATTHPPGGATALIAATLPTLPKWHGYRCAWGLGWGVQDAAFASRELAIAAALANALAGLTCLPKGRARTRVSPDAAPHLSPSPPSRLQLPGDHRGGQRHHAAHRAVGEQPGPQAPVPHLLVVMPAQLAPLCAAA